MEKTIGCCRWYYNWALAKKTAVFQSSGTHLSKFDLTKCIPALRKDPASVWLAEVDSHALQSCAYHIEAAFRNFFAGRAGFPTFKSKHRSRQSFTTSFARLIDGKLKLPKMIPIKLKGLREFTGKLKSVTVSKSPTGKYYASFLVDDSQEPPAKASVTEQGTVGIDLGLLNFITLSTGENIANPRHAKKLERLLRRRQRQLSRSKAALLGVTAVATL